MLKQLEEEQGSYNNLEVTAMSTDNTKNWAYIPKKDSIAKSAVTPVIGLMQQD